MRIYIFTDPFPTWSQTFIYDEIVGLEGLGHKIRIVSLFKERFVNQPILRKIKTRHVNYLSQYDLSQNKSISSSGICDYLKYSIINMIDNDFRFFNVNRLRALVRKERPDLFLAHFGALGEKFLWLNKEFDIPYIVFFHGCEYNISQRQEYNDYKESFYRADYFLVKSAYARRKIVELGCKPEKISIIPFGINPDNYEIARKGKKKKISRIKLLSVGRLVEYKNFLLTLDVINTCIRIYPNLEYDIIGTGPLYKEILNKIKLLGLQKVCFLHGAKNSKTVCGYMCEADIYVQPVGYDKYGETETFGNTFLEAQLHGLPVLSSSVGGVPETVIHNRTGFLAPEGDTKALTKYLLELIKNEELRRYMGENGKMHVLNSFNSKKRVVELSQILLSFVQK